MDPDDRVDRLDGLSTDVSASGSGTVRLVDARMKGRKRLEIELEAWRERRVERRAGREDGVTADFGHGDESKRRLAKEEGMIT